MRWHQGNDGQLVLVNGIKIDGFIMEHMMCLWLIIVVIVIKFPFLSEQNSGIIL